VLISEENVNPYKGVRNMRILQRAAAVTTSSVLVGLTLLPVGPAAAHHSPGHGGGQTMTVVVHDSTSYRFLRQCEGFWTLPAVEPPYDCDVIEQGRLTHNINLLNPPTNRDAVDIDWELVGVTAAPGVDYGGPASGTLTIPSNGTFGQIMVPVLDDGNPDGPSKTLEVRITGVSLPATIDGPGIGTILPGGNPPADCQLSRPDDLVTISTCTDRPGDQSWQLNVLCLGFGIGGVGIGNVVTGNGTSTSSCFGESGAAWRLTWVEVNP
jgi:hypothetical protein